MIYNVNTMELGINDVLQLVEIVLGEGKEFLFRISLLFVTYENIELILYLGPDPKFFGAKFISMNI